MSDIDWGDAPTWVAAVFAGGAAWFAGMTLRSQRRQIGEQQEFIREQSRNLQLERAELLTVAEERRTAQARTVLMSPLWLPSGSNTYGLEEPDHWEVGVKNDSAEAIYDVQVVFGDAYRPVHVVALGPGGAPTDEVLPSPVPLLGAKRGCRFVSGRAAGLVNAHPVLSFRDGAGLRWTLDRQGALTPQASEIPALPEATEPPGTTS